MRNLIIALTIFIGGCSTHNRIGIESYKKLDGEVARLTTSGQNNIIIKRDKGFFGSALKANIYLDGEKKFTLKPGQYYQFTLTTGDYFIMLESAKGANLGTAFKRSLRISIKDQSEKRHFRVFPMPMQGMVIEEISE